MFGILSIGIAALLAEPFENPAGTFDAVVLTSGNTVRGTLISQDTRGVV